MTRIQFFWLAATVCTVAAFGVRAQSMPSPSAPPMTPGTSGGPGNTGEGGMSLGTLDENGDAKVSKTEAAANPDLARKFNALDRNNDGQLDPGEFARFEVGGETSPLDRRSRGGASAKSDSEAGTDGDAAQPEGQPKD